MNMMPTASSFGGPPMPLTKREQNRLQSREHLVRRILKTVEIRSRPGCLAYPIALPGADVGLVVDGIGHVMTVRTAHGYGRESIEQQARLKATVGRAGGRYGVAHGLLEAHELLRSWGVL